MDPLVLVHGFMGGSDQWDLQQEELSKIRDVIALDLPGFGRRNKESAPTTIAGYAQDVLEQMEHKGIETFDLLGHSMGGMIVQEMTALAPDRIRHLILYATAATGNLTNRFESFEKSRQRAKSDGAESTADRISATWFLKRESAAEFPACSAIARRASLDAILAGLSAMETWSRIDNLPRISCPVSIIWGEADRTYGWEEIERMWTGITGASLTVIPGCAHAVHMEKPDLFNAMLIDRLSRTLDRVDI